MVHSQGGEGAADRVVSILRVVFFRAHGGREPVREWLLSLSRDCRRSVGRDIKTVQYGWPIGMPLIRKLDARLCAKAASRTG